MRTSLRSQSLDLLRFPLALFVVSVHVFYPHPALHNDYPAVQWVFAFIEAFISGQSVPVYYFIAGYVFFLGVEFSRTVWVGKLRRRVNSLLIPYLAWNLVALLYVLKSQLPGMDAVSEFSGDQLDTSLRGILMSFWDDSHGVAPYPTAANGIFPVDKPLWFVRDLMIMALASPLIACLYRCRKWVTVSVLSLATLVWIMRFPLPPHPLLLLEAFVFFAWGGYMSYHGRDLMVEFRRFILPSVVLYPLLALSVLLLTPNCPVAMEYVKAVNIIVGLFFFYNVSAWLISRGVCRVSTFLASASFFVYCGHFIIIDPVLRRIAALIAPTGALGTIAVYAATYVIVITILLLAYALMRRFTPRLLSIFTGGRR